MAEVQTTRELARETMFFRKLRDDYFALLSSVSPLALEAARKAKVAGS